MSAMVRVLGVLTLLAVPLGVAAGDTLPRYQFNPGQELAFRSTSEFKYGEGKNAGSHLSNSDWTVWVIRANKDGSYRLVLREKNTFAQKTGDRKNEQPAQTRIVYADVFPDGRILPNKTIQFRSHPGTLFPRLPANAAEANKGWESTREDDKTVATPLETGTGFVFATTTESPMNKVYLSSSKTKYTFDKDKGYVTRAESENTQGYGFNGRGTGTLELVNVKTIAPEELAKLAAATEPYFAAVAAYEDKTNAAAKAAPADVKDLLAQAVADLKAAAETQKDEALRADLTSKIASHERMASYYAGSAERRAKIVGKPAAEFEINDITGKKVRLADLKGQVVVLDFWYRGCGWCIKAMPQLNQLVDDFAGKPVAIFGMNTDSNEADARFVIEQMALKYPTLKAEGLPERFGVQGFPTLIVIDQQGKVHDIHVGYSPTLREELTTVIQGLLAKK